MDDKLKDFRNFLFICWKHLNLPDPTPVQYDIATFLQNKPKRGVIEAFRGVGKSYITSAFVCHTLLLDPEYKVLVVSASKVRSDDFWKNNFLTILKLRKKNKDGLKYINLFEAKFGKNLKQINI